MTEVITSSQSEVNVGIFPHKFFSMWPKKSMSDQVHQSICYDNANLRKKILFVHRFSIVGS